MFSTKLGGNGNYHSSFKNHVKSTKTLKVDLEIFIFVKKFNTTYLVTQYRYLLSSVADPDPGAGAFLTPGSGIRNRFFQDPGSRIPDPGSRIPRPYF